MLAVSEFSFAAIRGTLAPLAQRLRNNVEAVETAAGFLLIGGLGLIGAALPHFC